MTDRIEWAELTAVNQLLKAVHARIGDPPGGLTIFTSGGGIGQPRDLPVRIQWRRSYDGVLSDERDIEAEDLVTGLKAIIAWEDDADEREGPPVYRVIVDLGDDKAIRTYMVTAGDEQAARDIVQEVVESLIDVSAIRIDNPSDLDESEFDDAFVEGQS